MKFKELMQKLKPYAPLAAAIVVAVCLGVSLSGYKAKVYAVKEPDTESRTESVADDSELESESEEATGEFDLADGVYKGSANGYKGVVTVSVTIMDKKIASIDILSASDDEAFFNRAKGVIDKIIASQSLDVDVVSGATYSSNGIIKAVKNALTGEQDTESTGAQTQAQSSTGSASTAIEKVEEPAAYKDGTYYGVGKGFAGNIKVKVDISGGKIAGISIVETSDGSSYIKSASSILDSIVASQSTNVDTVSGATFSSKGIITAVRDALSQAAVSEAAKAENPQNTGNSQNTESTNNSSANSQPEGTLPYVDGIYYGTAEGYEGDITVAIVIQDKTLKAILVTDKSDDEPFFSNAMDVLKSIMKSQNTDVDTVSGATYSSKGLINAVKNAFAEADKATKGEMDDKNKIDTSKLEGYINQAKELNEKEYTQLSYYLVQIRMEDANEVMSDEKKTQSDVDKATQKLQKALQSLQKADDTGDNSGDNAGDNTTGGDSDGNTGKIYKDGVYEVTQLCSPDSDLDFTAYNLSMKVTIKGDRITEISDVSGDGETSNNSYIKKAVNGTAQKTGVVKQITDKGTTEGIDAVTRATCTSNAIIDGCNKALESAKLNN